MSKKIDLRGYDLNVRDDILVARKEGSSIEVPLDTVTSVLWMRENLLPAMAQKIGVLLILIPWSFFFLADVNDVFVVLTILCTVLGGAVIIVYNLLTVATLDIEAEGGNYAVFAPEEVLSDLRDRIDEFRSGHGMDEAVEEDRALDTDVDVYERVDRSTPESTVSMYDDIDACVRCGSTELTPPSIAEGGIPGIFDVSGHLVCRNCGLVAPALMFDRREDHEAHVAALKAEGRITDEGAWIPGSEDEGQD